MTTKRVFVLHLWATLDGRIVSLDESVFIAGYDPHARPGPGERDIGGGVVRFTRDADEAKRFESPEAALAFMQQQHPTVPTRWWDGRENRPVSAYHMGIAPLDMFERLTNGAWRILPSMDVGT
jgi:hypothetical protein